VSSRTLGIHSLLKAILLFGFAAYIATLVKSDAILYYIAPRMLLYVKLSAIALYIVGAYQLYDSFRLFRGQQSACDCGDDGHDHTPSRSLFKNVIFYGLFAFPLLIGFLMPDSSMGTALAAKKGMNLNSSSSVKSKEQIAALPSESTASTKVIAEQQPLSSGPPAGTQEVNTALTEEQLKQLFPSDKYTEPYAKHAKKLYKEPTIQVPEELYIETLTTLDLYADSFVGKTINLSGFVYRDEDMSDNQFVIGRFTVQCCSADAAPYGVLVQFDKGNLYATDQWIQLTGKIDQTEYKGTKLMVIQASRIQKIEAPKELYVYPNYEFGA
jgi:uncharacterized repeat protein (TIGR03943 family)